MKKQFPKFNFEKYMNQESTQEVKPKKGLDFAKELPTKKVQKNFCLNFIREKSLIELSEYLDKDFNSFEDFVLFAFNWSSTVEDHDYWRAISLKEDNYEEFYSGI